MPSSQTPNAISKSPTCCATATTPRDRPAQKTVAPGGVVFCSGGCLMAFSGGGFFGQAELTAGLQLSF